MPKQVQKLTDRKRQNIIDAAIIEFREKGFSDARTTQIAKRAKVSSRTLYNHFESKEVLFEAIVEIIFLEPSNHQVAEFDPENSIREQLIKTVNSYLDVITTDQQLGILRMALVEFLRDTELAHRAFLQVAIHDDPIKSFIKKAMEAGAIRKGDPEIASQQITSMVKALFHAPLLYLGEPFPLSKNRDDIVADCIDMFLSHYQA